VKNILACCLGFGFGLSALDAAEPPQDASDSAAIRAAIAKSLPLLEKSAQRSMEKRRQCFTCHNVGLPVMALTIARGRGFKIDEDNFRELLQFTADFLERNQANYRAGEGQGGQALTAGYALWTLENGRWKSDATTDAVAEYLLLWQKDRDHWGPQTVRPPSEGSAFSSSYVALRALKAFGTEAQQERISRRVERVRQWLLKTPANDTEDHVFRLWALRVASVPANEIHRAARALLETQQSDGGWAQRPEMASDAYATGTALVALGQTESVAATDANFQKGLRYLLKSQLEDGSWHVKTRSKPIQTYFESGFPHGEDQFISISATGWATTALALALPRADAPQDVRVAGELRK
jgi:N-acyl-D-amino-acid deacylase